MSEQIQAPRITQPNDSVRFLLVLADVDHGIETPLDNNRGRAYERGVRLGYLVRADDGAYKLTPKGEMFLAVCRKRICHGVLYFERQSLEAVVAQ